MADEIFTRYVLDAEGYKKGAQEIEAETAALVGDNKKLQTSFAETQKKTTQAFATDSVKKFSQETGKALKDVTKETNNLAKSTAQGGNAFLNMRKELKTVQGQLIALAAAGKEGGKLFKALSNEAGVLKDRMKDLGSTIELQAGDPLENLSTGANQLKGSLASLDFEGVGRSLSGLATNIGKIDLKSLKDGFNNVVGGVAKLGAAIISSPIFLIGAAIAGIVVVISTWGESLEKIREKNDRLIKGIDARLTAVTAGYDAEIIRLQASGQLTEEVEKKKLQAVIRATEAKIRLRQKEFDFELKNSALALKLLGKDKFQEVIQASDINKELIDLRAELTIAEAQFDAVDLKAEADKNKKQDELNKKANEDYKKALEERKKLLEAFNKEVLKLQSEERKQAANDIEDANKQITEITKKGIEEQGKARKEATDKESLRLKKALLENVNDETISFQQRNIQLQDLYDKHLIDFTEFSALKKKLIEDEVKFTIDQRKRELDATIQLGNLVLDTLVSFGEIAKQIGFENAEAQKAFAIFGITIDLAQSLGNAILAATEAGVFTGAAAPITTAIFIAQLTAAVGGAFAQAFTLVNQPTPSFAEGGWTGDGHKYKAAGIVHADEFVSTKEHTNKYWDELNAMHDGSFEDLMYYKYIQPALENAVRDNVNSSNKSFADNLSNSMLLNGMFKDGNILNALMHNNNSEGKRHKQLIQTIKKTGGKSQYRKK